MFSYLMSPFLNIFFWVQLWLIFSESVYVWDQWAYRESLYLVWSVVVSVILVSFLQ